MDQRKHTDYAILISSCDAYSDVWPYFVKCWDRFWPDCPYPAYLVSEELEFDHPTIGNIRLGHPAGWSDMLIEALAQIDSPNVIYLQEDYLLKGPTDMSELERLLRVFESERAAYLRLFPWPSADEPLPDIGDVGSIHPTSAYRTSLQAAVWDKAVLEDLLESGESGRDFEDHSPVRSADIERPFLSVYRPGIDYANMNDNAHVIDYFATAVFNRKWDRRAIAQLAALGIEIDPGRRGVHNRWDYWYFKKRLHPNPANSWLMRLIAVADRVVFNSRWGNALFTKIALRDRNQMRP
jgi:hypothetical protein